MTRKLWKCRSGKQYFESLEILKAIDSSDKFNLTEKYCGAALPDIESKRKLWKFLFSEEITKESLYVLGEITAGFR